MRINRIVILIWALWLGVTLPALAQASHFTGLKGSPDLRSASALVIGAGNEVIYGKDIDTVRPIASITKLMTVMVVIDSGLDLDEFPAALQPMEIDGGQYAAATVKTVGKPALEVLAESPVRPYHFFFSELQGGINQ